jgi:hypothetical protein
MATSGSFSTNHIAATSKKWYWDVSWWVSSWNGNTATISYEVYDRCETGTSGSTWVANYGFSGSIAGHNFANVQSGSFYKDKKRAWGSFTIGGGSSFTADITAHPYSGSYTSSGSKTWTLDNNVTTPVMTLTINSKTETVINAKLNVTNNGNASITTRKINVYSNSNCTTLVKSVSVNNNTNTDISRFSC